MGKDKSTLTDRLGTPISRRSALKAGGLGLASATLGTVGLRQPASANPAPTRQIVSDNVAWALSHLEDIVADAQERTGVPGIAACVVHNDQVVK